MTTTETEAHTPWRPPRIRHRYTPEERQRILRTVFLERSDGWVARFSTMTVLSVTIATLGLLGDSPAIVIGAMLIAPLMTPIQALSVAVAMGWGRRMLIPLATVVLATGGGVGLAVLLSWILPQPSEIVLPGEILSRTSPDLRDLLIALAAGAAGAYATAREDVSSALPGVAVAVALVPPLGVAGICLQLGRSDLAVGALLLFLANLIAILLAGITVLFVTGFVPLPHLRRVRGTVILGVVPVVAAAVWVTIPLAGALDRAVANANQLAAVNRRVATWLGPDASLEVDRVRVVGSAVELDLVGSEPPPPVRQLATQLSSVLGEQATVHVRWSLRQSADVVSTEVGSGGAQVATGVPELERLGQLAGEWLAAADPDGEVTGISRDDTSLVVTVASGSEPPRAATLRSLIVDRIGSAPTRVEVRWTQTRVYEATAGSVPQDSDARARAVVETWVDARPELTLDDVRVIDGVVDVRIRGPEEPDGVGELEGALRSSLGTGATLVLRFTPEVLLTTGTQPDAGAADEREQRVTEAVAGWSAGIGSQPVEIMTDDGGTVSVTVLGMVPPPPALALSLLVSEALGEPVGARVVWLGGDDAEPAELIAGQNVFGIAGGELFAPGTASLVPGGDEVLAAAAAELADVAIGVVIAGHPEAPGTEDADLALARERALVVRDWLVANGGLAAERIAVVAHDEAQPRAGDDPVQVASPGGRIEILVDTG